MATIQLDGLAKIYPNGHAAVRPLNLEIHDGECLVLVGPSGCGKSTLLRLIAGLEVPTAGRILIGGADVTGWPPQARDVAMVFQSYALYPHMSVRDNLAYGLKVRRTDRAIVARQVATVAEALNIQELLDRRPAQLSGGQRQRVALGRAMVRQPKAFLLDEPLSNLDPSLRAQARAELRRLHRSLGATIVYVTHDQEEAMTLADRIVVMRDGHIDQVGTPLEIYHDPVNLFVADFFGSPPMNLLEGEIHRENGATSFRAGEFIVHLSGSVPEVEGPVTLGIRPEHMAVGDAGSAGDKDFSAKIVLVEPLGKDILLYLDYGSEKNLIAVVEGHRNFQTGTAVSVHLQQDRLYYFGADERRLRPADAVRTAS